MSNTPTDPIGIPSATGIVANVGKEPIPLHLDLNRDGVLDYEQRWFRSGLANIFYGIAGAVFRNAPQTKVLEQVKPYLDAIAQTGAK